MFTGPTAIAYSAGPGGGTKRSVSNFAKDNEKLRDPWRCWMGDTVLDQDGVQALADLPSLDELRGKLVGMISRRRRRIASVRSPAGQLRACSVPQ